MTITVNDDLQNVAVDATVLDLVELLDLSDKTGIAIAVNEEVVRRSIWDSRKLQEEDHVTIIQATQGG